MPIFRKLLCGGWLLAVCQACAWAQTPVAAAQSSLFFELEHIANRPGAPFTQFVLVVNRSLPRAPRFSWQFAADGWAGGAEPYVSARLEACRRVTRERHEMQACGGLGAFHDVAVGGVSPVAAFSVDAQWGRGRASSYATFQRAFAAPTFTYYQAETLVQLWERRGLRVSTGVLSRTIQRLGGKAAVEVAGRAQVFVTLGSGQTTGGLSLRF